MESVENILKKPVNILVCFTDPKIGRVLSRMAVYLQIPDLKNHLSPFYISPKITIMKIRHN